MSFYTTKYLSIARKTLDSHLQLLFFLTKHLQPPPPLTPLFKAYCCPIHTCSLYTKTKTLRYSLTKSRILIDTHTHIYKNARCIYIYLAFLYILTVMHVEPKMLSLPVDLWYPATPFFFSYICKHCKYH